MRHEESQLQVAQDWATENIETGTYAALPGTSMQIPHVVHEDPFGSVLTDVH